MPRHNLCSTSVLCLAIASLSLVANPAFAQTPEPEVDPNASSTAQGDTAATESTSDAQSTSAGVEDIVVTAQRRAQSLQKAAVAIDAVSGEDLIERGITNAIDLTKTVPALTVTNGGASNTSLYLRGVGNRTTSSWTDPAIAVSYDGVFLGRSAGAFGSAFYDLERVEVLKGPQGILYGRNATGGAINVIPARPSLGD